METLKPFKIFITERTKLTSEFHSELNPKFWKNNQLNSEARDHMLKIAEEWREYCEIPKSAVDDIYFTGGNANYNYTKYSDVDIHLVLDMNKINKDHDLLKDYYIDKKDLWLQNHDINIYGYPVELAAQNKEDLFKKGQGIYSLKKDKWIQEPKIEELRKYTKDQIRHKVIFYKYLINKVLKGETDLEKIKSLREKIKNMRKAGLEKGGEFSFENIVYKELRNIGLIQKLKDYKYKIMDKSLSLESFKGAL